MSLRVLRFVALVLCALTMALTFCHLMEMPARMGWGSDLWVGTTVRGGQFMMFGTVGAALEVGAVLATLVLAWRLRHERSAAGRPSAPSLARG